MKVYVASSWRNLERHREVVRRVREAGHEVYDFTDPAGGKPFGWPQVTDLDCTHLGGDQVLEVLGHERSREGFRSDMNALQAADAVILVMPCGRSAHLELGYAVGASKLTIVLLAEQQEAELMWRMADAVTTNINAAVAALSPRLAVRVRARIHAGHASRLAARRQADHIWHINQEYKAVFLDAQRGQQDRLHARVSAYRGQHGTGQDDMDMVIAREAVLLGLDLPLCDAGCGRRVPDSEARAGFTTCEHCGSERCAEVERG